MRTFPFWPESNRSGIEWRADGRPCAAHSSSKRGKFMLIDVLIATHNRAAMLDRCVRSILDASIEPQFDFVITIIDNNCSDRTAQVIAGLVEGSRGRVHCEYEPRLGKSFAINTGLAVTSGDVIAFADDDQVMGDGWLRAIYRAIIEGYDFVSVPVYGEWEIQRPRWYDDRLRGALSLFDGGPERFAQKIHAVFCGGNAAVTRMAIEQVGGFHTGLGKIAGKFSMSEDGELLLRLKRAGFHGAYDPAMCVHHYVPRQRLTQRYFRQWYHGYGRSMAIVDTLHPQPVRYWLGVLRFLIRRTIESFLRMIVSRLHGEIVSAFVEELQLWFMLGFLKGKMTGKRMVIR